MTDSVKSFPEQHASDLESTSSTRQGLLDLSSALPVSTQNTPKNRSRTLALPHFPNNPRSASSPSLQSSSLARLDSLPTPPTSEEELRPILNRLSRFKTESTSHQESSAFPSPPSSEHHSDSRPLPPSDGPEKPRRKRPNPAAPTEADEFKAALFPFVEETIQKTLYDAPRGSMHSYLEPMLRQTVRRAIAEQMESARIFRDIGSLDRLLWHLHALVSSRTYDEIVFDRTRRYQVEELYLLSHDIKWMLSYASYDPARHGSPRRVKSTVRLLRSRAGALRGGDYSAFDLPEGRLGVVREGQHTTLVAVMRGRCNALIRSDLDYLQHQIEERYGRELRDPNNIFLQTLQPILEGGLLIQAPPAS